MAYRRYKRESYGENYKRLRRKFKKYSAGGSTMARYGGYALKAWNLAKMLKGLINTESKYGDSGIQTLTPTNAGGVSYLSGLAQGLTNITRVGNSILAKSILLNIQCVINASATNTVVRLVLFVDHDNQGATPAVTDLIQSADARAFINRVNGKRFSVLKDWQYVLNTSTGAQQNDKVFLRLAHHIKYSGTDAAIGSQLQGAMFLMVISDQATNTPTVIYNSRLRYIDN
nr:capsid protein [Cressdnaviricota sp.]